MKRPPYAGKAGVLVAGFLGNLSKQIHSPVFWLLIVSAALRLPGLTWGLPGSDGWDSDGVAPRDFLVGVIKTYQAGEYFTYPPLHLLVLTAFTSPGWIVAIIKAPSLAQGDLIAEFIKIPYMTFFAVTARLIGAVLSLATIACAGKIGEEIGGKQVGICVAAVCALNATLTYYGQTSNLDGPYIFWSLLAVWQWTCAIARHEVVRFPWALLFTVASIATKDQAYAVFVVSIPLVLAMWFAADPWPRQNARRILVTLLVWGSAALLLLLAVDGALTNPTGFGRRLAFLVGSASQDHAYYLRDLHGHLRLLWDAWNDFPRYYPAAGAFLAVLGLLAHAFKAGAGNRGGWVAGFLPFFAVISFTVAFNFVTLRTENRFVLPQSVFLSIYAGLGADWLLRSSSSTIAKWPTRIAVSLVALLALYQCLAVDAALLNDPRYDAERWLRDHAHGDDAIETYGLNVYLPRFGDAGAVTRVWPTPIQDRSPLPGITELQQIPESIETRSPKFIVVSDAWALRYLQPADSSEQDGRMPSREQLRLFEETATRNYFQDLYQGKLPYRLALSASYQSRVWPIVHVHESLAETINIFERAD